MVPVAATGFIVLGVGLLYASWASWLPAIGRALGWGSILLGMFAWTTQTGADRGIALALILLCVVGLCFLGVSATATVFSRSRATRAHDTRRKRPRIKRPAHSAERGGFWVHNLDVWRRLGWFFLAGPAAALVAFTAALASHQALLRAGVAPANALVTELFLFPVLWGCLAIWCLMASHLWRRSADMAVLQCITGVWLLVVAS